MFTLLPLLTGKGREHHGDIMREATKLAEAGKLIPNIDVRAFTMKMVEEAYGLMDSQQARGKVVVDI